MIYCLCFSWRYLIRYIVVKNLSIDADEEKDHIQFWIVVSNYFCYLVARPAASLFQLFAGIGHVVCRYGPGRVSVYYRTLEVDHYRPPDPVTYTVATQTRRSPAIAL